MQLVCHPDTPASHVSSVSVELSAPDADTLLLRFEAVPGSALSLARRTPPERTDGLWRTTCFELFIRSAGDAYVEFNLSPSTQWAAYHFDRYREGMRDLDPVMPPRIEPVEHGDRFQIEALIRLNGILARQRSLALSAVIEETDGTKSYWALAHPPGAPDFHHPDCFVLDLATT